MAASFPDVECGVTQFRGTTAETALTAISTVLAI